MPQVTEKPVKAYAHCRNALCAGYMQEEIDATREETAFTYGENGGDGIFAQFIERSTVDFKFTDEAQVPCPVCSQPREISGEPRPSYQPLSGHDPMGLLASGMKYNPAVMNTQQDAEVAELKAQLAQQQAQMAELMAVLKLEEDA